MQHLFNTQLASERVTRVTGLVGAAHARWLTELSSKHSLIVCLVADSVSAARLKRECQEFAPNTQVVLFPDWETLPYDHFSPHQDIIAARLRALHQLQTNATGILIAPVSTLMHRLMPIDFLHQHSFKLSVGDILDVETWRQQLTHAGYHCVNQVMQPGEFAIRGSILDFYPMTEPSPIRIDRFDNEIDTLRYFDPDTQRSGDKLQSVECLPAKEFPCDTAGIEHFRSHWRSKFEGAPLSCSLYEDVSQGMMPAGIEYYLPLFFDQTATLFDYLPADTVLVHNEALQEAMKQFWHEIEFRHDQRAHDIEHPILPPSDVFLTPDAVNQALKPFKQAKLVNSLTDNQTGLRQNTQPIPDVSIAHHAPQPLKRLEQCLSEVSGRVLFCAESLGRREQLLTLLKSFHLAPKQFETFDAFIEDDSQSPYGLLVLPVDLGFYAPDANLVVIAETDLYGEQVQQRRHRKNTVDPDYLIRNVIELTPGTPVVHLDHGVGRFDGLKRITVDKIETEFLCLSYYGADKIYVPVSSLHLISRYQGTSQDKVHLNKLGSDTWEKAKRRATEKVRDVAAELLALYARRKARVGVQYPDINSDYQAFCTRFPYETTPDQQRAIDEVVADLTATTPMDRLVCGDVGFGKTEVAMRAAFWVAYNGKQVAILVPTTLLAQQHYENFQTRFADLPVKVGVLTRFQTAKEQKAVIEQLASGHIDIIIGTHKLLQPAISFKDIGLVVVDEEHRFGVRHKEKLKSLRSEVDILTMTATPIPRTLNMAMAAIRDLSVITTPPAKRLSIKTFVYENNDSLIRESILRELMRGGQVYFLHNDVATIENCRERLENILPEARLGIAHGQMPERQLEQVMRNFYHQKFNVLVCSTIIETGIDIPTANTIIMERADKLGLAQLHQLRGRVGRSHHQAYCYCLTPPTKALTKEAKLRLEALSTHEELGAGFHIASQDLEIRGAGELLGESQSGQIESIGFSLYMEMLDHAVKAIKSGKVDANSDPLYRGAEIDCHVPALIPDNYLPDIESRIILYNRIANAKDKSQLSDLKAEMIDRFGLLPEHTQNLFAITEIKLKAQPLNIKTIKANEAGGSIEFANNTPVSPMTIVGLIQKQPQHFQLQGQTRLRFRYNLESTQKRMDTIKNILDKLCENSTNTSAPSEYSAH